MTMEHFVANSEEEYQIGDFERSLVYEIDKETIGQYTGLHDKNGKEIYEGDIVNVFVCGDYIKGYIKYNNKRGRFDVGWISELQKYKNGEEFIGSCSCMYNEYDDLEVIGNIWED